MKRCTVLALCLLLFTGCTGAPDEMDTGMELRSKLLQAESASFTAEITADYGDKVHIFTMDCKADPSETVFFTVTAPDSISGIAGKLTKDRGEIIFDETALSFDPLAEDQLSPISAPWIMVQTLRSGYITSACTEEGCVRLSIDDSYEDNALHLDIWLNSQKLPDRADILYDGRRILSIEVANFEIL